MFRVPLGGGGGGVTRVILMDGGVHPIFLGFNFFDESDIFV